MDDILASIRRIIADDDALPLSRAARAAPPPPPRPPATQASAPAAPPPPVATAADALLGFGQRLFRNGEAAPAETATVSTFRAPAPRAPVTPTLTPARAPTLKLRDFAPSFSRSPRPTVGEIVGPAKKAAVAEENAAAPAEDAFRPLAEAIEARPADSAVEVKAIEAQAAEAKPSAKAIEAKTIEPKTETKTIGVKAIEAHIAVSSGAPDPEAAEPAKADSAGASVSSLAEARLKVAPSPLRAPAAPPEEPQAASPHSQTAEAARVAEKAFEVAPAGPSSRRVPAPSAAPVPAEESGPALLSPASGARIGASFEALAESLMLRDPQMLERVAREMLRPMLKIWLDDNLPIVVERLVRVEIERIARGRG